MSGLTRALGCLADPLMGEVLAVSYHYSAYGLSIESDLPLPELAPACPSPEPDLTYRRASLCDTFENQVDRPPVPMREQILFLWQDMCRFAMRNGDTVLYDPEPAASDEAVRLILLGICTGIALHQRGNMVLHGSAVDVDGRALAFMGAKEAGKSTMVGALVQRGHRLIADDLVVLYPHDGTQMLAPGYPSIKMWPATAEMLGLDVDAMPPLHDMVDKRWFMVGDRFQPEPKPLAAMVVLDKGDGPRIEPILRGEALMRIVEQTYALRFLGKRGATPDYFQASTELVRRVPVFRLTRPMDADAIPHVVESVEVWARTLGSASGGAHRE